MPDWKIMAHLISFLTPWIVLLLLFKITLKYKTVFLYRGRKKTILIGSLRNARATITVPFKRESESKNKNHQNFEHYPIQLAYCVWFMLLCFPFFLRCCDSLFPFTTSILILAKLHKSQGWQGERGRCRELKEQTKNLKIYKSQNRCRKSLCKEDK